MSNEQRYQDWCRFQGYNADSEYTRNRWNELQEFRQRQQSQGWLDACEAEERQ